MKDAERPVLYRWSRRQYARLIHHGFLDRVLEVCREPARPGPARRRWGYASIDKLSPDALIAPLAVPTASIRVADLLP